jgi:hypothetical protein
LLADLTVLKVPTGIFQLREVSSIVAAEDMMSPLRTGQNRDVRRNRVMDTQDIQT